MIDEQVHINTELANVPVVHLGVGSLEHHALLRELLHDRRDDIGAPRLDVLGDTLGLDHETLNASVEEAVAHVDQLARVGGADGFEAGGGGVTAGAELDANLRLGLEFVGVDLVDQAEPVVAWDGEETAGEFNYVESGAVVLECWSRFVELVGLSRTLSPCTW